MNCRPVVVTLASLVLLVGCGGPNPNLSKEPEVVAWPELQALSTPELTMPLFRYAQMGDGAGFKTAATNPQFVAAVDKFEATPIPDKFASPAREAAKKEVVAAYRTVIEKAKAGVSGKEAQALTESLGQATGKLVDPNLK